LLIVLRREKHHQFGKEYHIRVKGYCIIMHCAIELAGPGLAA